jgi:hypothetical protein
VKQPVTLDGRYFVVRGRLRRMANPDLDETERVDLVGRLMAARRSVRDAKERADREAEAAAHMAVDEAGARRTRSGVVGRWLAGFQPAYGEEHSVC